MEAVSVRYQTEKRREEEQKQIRESNEEYLREQIRLSKAND